MTSEIISALRVLYGQDVSASPLSLKTFHQNELKAVFRQRAFELHPDRAAILGKSPEALGEAFKDVKLAYEMLLELLGPTLEKEEFVDGDFLRGERIHGSGRAGDHFWGSGIPDTKLLLGQFLYYAGVITFNNLVSAVTWQRQQRPSFGKIARSWEYLSEKQLHSVIFSRAKGEKIGQTAQRLGHLNRFQCNTVLGFQRYLQRPIGEFFKNIGVLNEEEMDYLVKLQTKHNIKMAGRGGESRV
jgi:hypothetical protein